MSVFGIDEAALRAWFARNVASRGGVLAVEPIVGGRSNLTYRVTDTGGDRWVVRRPPVGRLAGGAHDVLREARIIRALRGSAVPVPDVVAVCSDESVVGAPFVVMRHVDGLVPRTPADVAALPETHRDALTERLIGALVALHNVVPDDVGLGEIGRRDAYLRRQLRRWMLQSQREECERLDELRLAHDALVRSVPPQTRCALVHGDFRLENCILDGDGHIAAVLDWELCTLGDPLADLGLLLAYWAEPGDTVTALEHPPTLALGAGGRDRVRRLYQAGTGVTDEHLAFYEAFGWWKLACIVGGVHARVRRGAIEPEDRDEPSFRRQAARLAQAAAKLTSQL